jgi:hypothetical protein
MDRSLLPTWGFEYLSHRVCGNGGISIEGEQVASVGSRIGYNRLKPLRGIPGGQGQYQFTWWLRDAKAPFTLNSLHLKGIPKVSEAAECQLREWDVMDRGWLQRWNRYAAFREGNGSFNLSGGGVAPKPRCPDIVIQCSISQYIRQIVSRDVNYRDAEYPLTLRI